MLRLVHCLQTWFSWLPCGRKWELAEGIVPLGPVDGLPSGARTLSPSLSFVAENKRMNIRISNFFVSRCKDGRSGRQEPPTFPLPSRSQYWLGRLLEPALTNGFLPPKPLNPQSEMVPPSEGQVPPFPGLDSQTAEVRWQ